MLQPPLSVGELLPSYYINAKVVDYNTPDKGGLIHASMCVASVADDSNYYKLDFLK